MIADQVHARSAVEALRAGVPSRHAVEQLGTTQTTIRDEFQARLEAAREGRDVEPIVVAAGFGAGKSHLLNCLKTLAAKQNYVTSLVVVGPEMPIGNAHIVLKAIVEAAEAPGHLGRAARALAFGLETGSPRFAALRHWARDGSVDDRFAAMLHLFEELRADEEFRDRILDDFEGSPIKVTEVRQRLKEIGQTAGYAIKGKKNALLAHDRIRLLAQFYHACGCDGWVVLFDELERFGLFPPSQRLPAWEELGWWRAMAKTAGARILPVFAVVTGALEETIRSDQVKFGSRTLGLDDQSRDERARDGIDLLNKPIRLPSPGAEEAEEIKYRVKAIYERAYEMPAPYLPVEARVHSATVRSEIRRWITQWDLHRYNPDYAPSVVEEAIVHDTSEVAEDAMASDDEAEAGAL